MCFESADQLGKLIATAVLGHSSAPYLHRRRRVAQLGEKFRLNLHLRNRVPPPGAAPGTQSIHRRNWQSALSAHLADSAPGSPLRRTGPSGEPKLEATPHRENDPRTPTPRLPDRTDRSIEQYSMNGGDFRPRFSTRVGGRVHWA